MSKERPILFRPYLAAAIARGQKTVTRRRKFDCQPGDTLWVRETFATLRTVIEFQLRRSDHATTN